jgi:hypothetical protein
MRWAAKVDLNHGAVVEALLSVEGVSIHSLAGVANVCPDLLVGARDRTYLAEIKNGELCPSRRELTPAAMDRPVDRSTRGHSHERGRGLAMGQTHQHISL